MVAQYGTTTKFYCARCAAVCTQVRPFFKAPCDGKLEEEIKEPFLVYSRATKKWSKARTATVQIEAKKLKCPYSGCNWSFDYQSALERHIQEKHKKGKRDRSVSKTQSASSANKREGPAKAAGRK